MTDWISRQRNVTGFHENFMKLWEGRLESRQLNFHIIYLYYLTSPPFSLHIDHFVQILSYLLMSTYPSEYVILIAIELHEVDCLILCKCYMQLLDSVEYIKLNDLYTLSHAWSIGWFGVRIWSLNPKLTGFRFE